VCLSKHRSLFMLMPHLVQYTYACICTHTHTHTSSLSLSLSHTQPHIYIHIHVCVCVCVHGERKQTKKAWKHASYGMGPCHIWQTVGKPLANRWQTASNSHNCGRVYIAKFWICLPSHELRGERERERERGREGGRIRGNSIYERGSRPGVLCLFFFNFLFVSFLWIHFIDIDFNVLTLVERLCTVCVCVPCVCACVCV